LALPYNPALDGLRALAVTAVVVQHAGFEEGGYFGVTVFFVISGYLITSLLLAEHASTASIDVAAFYRRRVARLAPALLLAAAAITIWLLATSTPLAQWWAGLLGTLTYTTDVLLVTPVWPHVGTAFEWSWSLGIEEQFYLVWPILMIWMLRRHNGRRWLALVAAGVVVAAWIQRARLSTGHPTHARVNFAFDVHMDSIALGAILALVLAGWPVVSRQLRAVAELLGIVAAVAVFAVIRQPWQTMKLTTYDLGGYGQVALLCLFVVAVAVIAPTGGFARALSLRPLVHVGKLSYGIYLWNQLLALICLHMTGHLPARTGAGLLVWALVLLAVAQLSYRFVENPLRTRWGQRRGRSLATVAG